MDKERTDPIAGHAFDEIMAHFLSAGRAFHQLCQPLFESTDIGYVGYLYLDEEAHAIPILSDPGYYRFFLESRLYQKMYGHIKVSMMQSGYYQPHAIFDETEYSDFIQKGIAKYKQYNRFLVIRRQPRHCDMVMFAFGEESPHHLNFCINNLSLLNRFIDDINPQIEKLRRELLPLPLSFRPLDDKSQSQQPFGSAHAQAFLGRNDENVNAVTSANKIELTKREQEVLYHVLLGKSAKEIAIIAHMSPRTVENYIDKLKDKYQCDSKNKLISLFVDQYYIKSLSQKK